MTERPGVSDSVSQGEGEPQEYVKIGFCSRSWDCLEESEADSELTLAFNDIKLNCHRATIACLIAMLTDIIYCEYAPQQQLEHPSVTVEVSRYCSGHSYGHYDRS